MWLPRYSPLPNSFSNPTRFLALLAVLLTATPNALPQILYGGIVGELRDSGGAVVPNARVTALNTETGVSRVTTTNPLGQYTLPTLNTGNYTVTFEAAGFQTLIRKSVSVSVNSVTRIDASLELGQITQQITVETSTPQLQTDRAEVRTDVEKTTLQNAPLPLGRNYQMILNTIPGFSPGANSNSVPSNPSRSVRFSVNGTSSQTNSVRIDGITSYNPDLQEISGLNPTLEAIEVVNVVTSSFDAEQGLAGGAAINVQIKGGSNNLHGSAFWYHNNQHLSAYPFFSDRNNPQPKFIFNQAGGTLGGPIKRNRIFYFMSYEGTSERSNVQRFITVPTAAMRAGDLSASPTQIYDPLSGAAFNPANPNVYANDRVPFPNKQIPASRFSAPTNRLFGLNAWALPNYPGRGPFGLTANHLASGSYAQARSQVDGKTNFYFTDKWTAFARLSFLTYNQDNPAPFGILGGPAIHPTNSRHGFGYGPTYSGTVSTTYAYSSNLIFDAYFGAGLNDTNAGPLFLDRPVARDTLGIPGTNGSSAFEGGMVRMLFDGFDQLGYSQVTPLFARDYQYQYVFNTNLTRGAHDIRFGFDSYIVHLNHLRANAPGAQGGPPGGFTFRNATTTLRGGPAGNEFNTISAFLLGLPREAGRSVMASDELRVRTRTFSAYVRDRWNATSRLTLSYGLRWEFFPFPTRDDRGLERFDIAANQMLRCGVGSVPKNCGNDQSKRLFAPRAGLAFRVTPKLVLRAGYGLTYDPFNVGKDLEGTYPNIFSQNLPFNDTRAWSTTLATGLPAVSAAPQGERIPMPLTAAVYTVDDNYDRGYIQSWNLTLERQLGTWTLSSGYVATRSVRQSAQIDVNWAEIGTGANGRQLARRYNRLVATTVLGHVGTPKYDSLQTRLTRRMGSGTTINVAYTWAHSRGYTDEASFTGLYVNHPAYWSKNYGPTPNDIRHNLALTGATELPFGKNKRWATRGLAAALAGGWQLNILGALYTGTPVNATAPGTVLNAPGSGQYADCNGPVQKIGSIDGWWSRSTLADPDQVDPRNARFGSCGARVLRGPALINFDAGVFRRFDMGDRFSLQFRGEVFNLSNTPHFANPSGAIAGANFGVVTAVRNTGREGNDQRFFRLGLRLAF